MNETITLEEFIAANRITMDCEWTEHNPEVEENPRYPMNHYKCTLKMGTQRMSVPFSMGMAHTEGPDLLGVLDCLASDAKSWENYTTFEGWAEDYGYDPDSRRAERVFKAVEVQSRKLESFLGEDLYKQLLNTERQ
jgi:hypothetical protein